MRTILLTLISLFSCAPPQTASELAALGVQSQKNTDTYEAISLFSKAIKKDPLFTEAYEERASAYLSIDSLSAAIKDYDTLIAQTKNQQRLSGFYLLKGNALYLNSQDSLACKSWKTARDLNNLSAWDKIRKLCK